MNYQHIDQNQFDVVDDERFGLLRSEIEPASEDVLDQTSEVLARTFEASAPICFEGDERELVVFMLSGVARVYKMTFDGTRKIVAFLYPGEMFVASIDGECRYSIESVTRCECKLYPWTSVTNWISTDPVLAEKFINESVKNALAAHQHVFVISQRCATQRVSAFLLELSDRTLGAESNNIFLPVQRDIADYLGLAIETVCRQLTMFKEQGIVRRHNRRTLEIIDFGALVEFSGEPETIHH